MLSGRSESSVFGFFKWDGNGVEGQRRCGMVHCLNLMAERSCCDCIVVSIAFE